MEGSFLSLPRRGLGERYNLHKETQNKNNKKSKKSNNSRKKNEDEEEGEDEDK